MSYDELLLTYLAYLINIKKSWLWQLIQWTWRDNIFLGTEKVKTYAMQLINRIITEYGLESTQEVEYHSKYVILFAYSLEKYFHYKCILSIYLAVH